MNAGASIYVITNSGLTPLHLCATKCTDGVFVELGKYIILNASNSKDGSTEEYINRVDQVSNKSIHLSIESN